MHEDATPDQKFRNLCPHLVDFGRLFYPAIPKECHGLRTERGIPHGSTLLLSGAPGAGKTVFALSFVRGLMCDKLEETAMLPDKFFLLPKVEQQPNPEELSAKIIQGQHEQVSWNTEPVLYYVSLEVFPERLRTVGQPFGWLTSDDPVFRVRENANKLRTIEIVTAQPEIDRPVPDSEALVSSIFAKIGRLQEPGKKRPVIVIIDSLTALMRTGGDEGEQRRQAHEAMFRLQKIFGRHRLLLTILITERGATHGSGESISIEEYLADIVFRLDLKELPLGRRLRTLEIPKSQGLPMVTGLHTWCIVTNKSAANLFKEEQFTRRIAAAAGCENVWETSAVEELMDHSWGTTVILPRSLAIAEPQRP